MTSKTKSLTPEARLALSLQLEDAHLQVRMHNRAADYHAATGDDAAARRSETAANYHARRVDTIIRELRCSP